MVEEVRDALGRAVSSWPRRLLIIGTILLGAGVAVLIAMSLTPPERTLPTLLSPAQSVMSILTPLVGIVLVDDLRRARRAGRVVPALLAGLLVVVGITLLGVIFCVATATQADGLARLTLGSVLVHAVALLTGTGLGMLIPSRVLAFLATIVIPLGLWRLFGTVDVLEPARGWLTPFESARRLLADGMTPFFWLQFVVMVLVWDGTLNALGARQVRRTRSSGRSRSTAAGGWP